MNANHDFFFHPYVGKNYGGKTAYLHRRLLVCGASHYCDGCYDNPPHHTSRGETVRCNDGCGGKMTIDTIQRYRGNEQTAKNEWRKTYTRFFDLLAGHETSQAERNGILDELIFYNYLQEIEGVNGLDSHPEKFSDPVRRERDLRLFKKLLREYQPETVILWGDNIKRVFPDDLGGGPRRKAFDDSKLHPYMQNRVWLYPFDGRALTVCMAVHPSVCKDIEMKKVLFKKLDLFD